MVTTKNFPAFILLSALLMLGGCGPGMEILGDDSTFSLFSSQPKEKLPDTPPLYCKVGRGLAYFDHDWYDFGDTQFALYKGSHTNIRLSRLRNAGDMTVQGFFDNNGQKLVFCPFIESSNPNQRIPCASFYALDDDLRDGIKRTFDIPNAVRGGNITCAYSQERLRPLATPTGFGN